MAISDWIKKARTKAGLTQEQLADAIGRKKLSISRWENGERIPNADDLLKISMVTGVSVELPHSPHSAPEVILNATAQSTAEMDVSGDIPTSAIGKETYPYTEMIRVPIYEDAYAACAGNGNHNEGAEPAVMEYRLFDISEVGPISADPDKHPFGIRVEGESMEEANIPDGSIAVINPGVEWNSGTPVLAKIGETCVIKWVETRGTTLVFYSASSAYPPRSFTLEEQKTIGINVIGPVVDVRLRPKWMR